MNAPTRPVQVAISAVPTLLAGSLRAMLACEGVELTLVVAATRQRFDVAVVAPGAPAAPADLLVELSTREDGEVDALVRDVDAGLRVQLHGLEEVGLLLRLLGAARSGGRTPSLAELGLGPSIAGEAPGPDH